MAENRAETIEAAVRSSLAAIVGDAGANYWFTPSVALRHFGIVKEMFDASVDLAYFVIGDDIDSEEDASYFVTKQLPLDVVGIKRFIDDERPFKAIDPKRGTIQLRMLRDVERKLRLDYQPGGTYNGLVENIDVVALERSHDRTYMEGFAVVFARVLITYSHPADQP